MPRRKINPPAPEPISLDEIEEGLALLHGETISDDAEPGVLGYYTERPADCLVEFGYTNAQGVDVAIGCISTSSRIAHGYKPPNMPTEKPLPYTNDEARAALREHSWPDDAIDLLLSHPEESRHLICRIMRLKDKHKRTTTKAKKPISAFLRRQVFERDAYRCKTCGGWESLVADHVFPESRGGATTLDNLQTLCWDCNTKKGAKTQAEWDAVR